ncbi:MAG: BrnT family toxin [Spirochaetota bacterium]
MKFEWDQHKAEKNVKKHNISFENAAFVFADKDALTIFDEDHSDLEDRWITLGQIPIGSVILVVHTYRKTNREEVIRIISARTATKSELKQYLNAK